MNKSKTFAVFRGFFRLFGGIALWGSLLVASANRLSAQNLTCDGSLPRGVPEAEGVSSDAIADLITDLDREIDTLHSLMILRHGKVIAETWWAPQTPQSRHALYSLSKSFTSTAVGFAVAEGRLDLDDAVISFFPDDLPNGVSENLKKMRVRDLLSMSCGHDNETSYSRETWVKSFLAHPVVYEPGTHFQYNTPGTYILSAVIQKVTGQTVLDYLTPRLFDPLAMEKPFWETSPQGITKGGTGLFLTTEEIAKFGQFYLQKGEWNGEQLLPSAWIETATSKKIDNGTSRESDWQQGYAFQFWRCRHNAYRGDGRFCQFCLILPDQDAVVVMTSDSGEDQEILNLVWKNLLPALGDKPLAPNENAQKRLAAAMTHLIAGRGVSGISLTREE